MRLNKDEYSKLHNHQTFLKEIARIDKDMPLARLITLLDVMLYPNRIGRQIAKSTVQGESSANRHINYWRHTFRGKNFPDKTPWLLSEITPNDFRIKKICPTERGISQMKRLAAGQPLEISNATFQNYGDTTNSRDLESSSSPKSLASQADRKDWAET